MGEVKRVSSMPVVGNFIKLCNQAYCIEDLFREDYYAKVRNCVMGTSAKLTGREESYIGYIYKMPDGKYDKYNIVGGICNAARFICSCDADKMLCTSDDYPLLCTIGNCVDLISGEASAKECLLEEVKEYQDKKVYPIFEEL